MKFSLSLIVLCVVAMPLMGQSARSKKMVAAIISQWQTDDSGNVFYQKQFNVPGIGKDDLFLRAKAYLAYNYNSGKDVVQVEDKEAGLLIGKGFYPNLNYHQSDLVLVSKIGCYHILHIDVKEERVRVTITASEYETIEGYNATTKSVINTYPFGSYWGQKNYYARAFANLHKQVLRSHFYIEKALKEGNVGNTGKKDW